MNSKIKIVLFIVQAILMIIMTLGVVLSLILGDSFDIVFIIPTVISFLLFIICLVVGIIKKIELLNYDLTSIKLVYRIILILILLVFFGIGIAGFCSNYIYGGSAQIVDGSYQIINRGEFVRYISKEEYNCFNFFQRYSWISFYYDFLILFMLRLKFNDKSS